jgi:hypothetical protein
MKTIVNVLVCASTLVLPTACALLAPIGLDSKARSAAAVMLETHAVLQEAVLIYGQLPPCSTPPLAHICREPRHWLAVRQAERLATDAILAAAPVLDGSTPDTGEILRAMEAIDALTRALAQGRARIGETRR